MRPLRRSRTPEITLDGIDEVIKEAISNEFDDIKTSIDELTDKLSALELKLDKLYKTNCPSCGQEVKK